MFEIRTNFRGTSIKSLLVTRPHYSKLYGKIERFERFLRVDVVQADVFQTCARDNGDVHIAFVDCAR